MYLLLTAHLVVYIISVTTLLRILWIVSNTFLYFMFFYRSISETSDGFKGAIKISSCCFGLKIKTVFSKQG